jgi:tetraacyldisaccharide 4'-kinase
MNFNAPLLKPIRILLFPISLVYGAIIITRNWLYNANVLGSTSFNFPVICVGNLSAGGTGKSPMVESLIRHLKKDWKVAVLSRGYKRKTKGFVIATETSTALEIGDEPFLFHSKFPDITVSVGEQRLVAIPQLLHEAPDTELILLDDAYQHRSVKAGMNILLTDYNNLFTRDWFLPTGDLRDQKASYKRADVLVVTKCMPDLPLNEAQEIKNELRLLPHQRVFFSCIRYGTPYHLGNRSEYQLDDKLEILLVTGIADPRPLKKYIQDNSAVYYEMIYRDHYVFTIDDWKDILRRFNSIPAERKIILTTEKDAARLLKFQHMMEDVPIYVLPIQMKFLFGEADSFFEIITTFIETFRKKITRTDGQKTT